VFFVDYVWIRDSQDLLCSRLH